MLSIANISSLLVVIVFLTIDGRHSKHIVKRSDETTETVMENTKTKLVVSAGNATTIQLPRDQVVLSSFVFPESSNYKYNWELISPLNGQDFGNMEGINENQVKLTHLKVGNYVFKVTVTGDNVDTGSAYVNVTVLPMKTENKAPIVIVEPKNATLQLPLAETILDGSTSIDDDRIVKYEWKAVEVPIGYKIIDSDSPILKLQDLIAGKYVFNLTVTDSRNATNSALAQINVLKEIDYPPKAIVDPVIVVSLPQDEVIISGNKSTDDKEIITWHWTRGDNGPMAIDMDGTSTPNLHLSKLEVGSYMFSLQITDTSGQTSKAETHLIVKQVNNEAPNSDAGDNIQVTLPITGPIKLDGTKSTDDVGIIAWNWTQISGPKILSLRNGNTSIALIDSAFPGVYNFSLEVIDIKNLSSISYKSLTIIQNKNIPPKADAGGDQTVILPITEIFLNGSKSYDDIEIETFRWERMPLSSAFGQIIGSSDRSSILRLTNLIPGRYLFKLTVTDSHGASSSDVASLIVKPEVDQKEQIELVLNVDSESFTYEQEVNFYKKLEALLSETEQIQIKPITVQRNSEKRTILIFVIEESKLKPEQIVYKIRTHIRSDMNFFALQVLSVGTVVCQNRCSNHGTCDQSTKRCMCEAFWMENIFRFYYGDYVSNCDWSILYVIIICFLLLLFSITLIWLSLCLVSQNHSKRSGRRARYGRNVRHTTNRFRYMLIDESQNLELTTSLKANTDTFHDSSSTDDNILVDYQNNNNNNNNNNSIGNSTKRLRRNINNNNNKNNNNNNNNNNKVNF